MYDSASLLMTSLLAVVLLACLLWLFFKTLALPSPAQHPHSNFVDLDDCRVHYIREGSGPELVLLHGIGASNYIWRFVSPLWAKNFTVTAIDIPGFGRSSKERNLDYGLEAQVRRLNEILDKLEIEKATLIGSSMGGAIALWAAKLNPLRFAKVVAISPATNPLLVPRFVAALRYFTFLSRAANRWTIRPFLGNAVTRQELITQETIAAYLIPFSDPASLHALYLATNLLRDARLPRELSALQSQVLLMYGKKDKVIHEGYMLELLSIFPLVTYVTHENAGHHPMEDEPEWVEREVFDFLSK